jgi:hypothetical protein
MKKIAVYRRANALTSLPIFYSQEHSYSRLTAPQKLAGQDWQPPNLNGLPHDQSERWGGGRGVTKALTDHQGLNINYSGGGHLAPRNVKGYA